MRRRLALTAATVAATVAAVGTAAPGALADGSSTTTTPSTSSSAASTATAAASTATTATRATSSSAATTTSESTATAAGTTATAPATTATTAASSTTPTTTPPPSTNAAPPAKAAVTLSLPDAFVVHRDTVTVPGRLLEATGVVKPYVPGQWVVVKAFLGHKQLKSARLRIKPSSGNQTGQFTEQLRSPKVGIVRIEVTHTRTPQMAGFSARRAVAAVNEQAGFGSRATIVPLVQQRLADLHFYIPQTGVYDQKTGLTLDAYHRLLRRGVSQRLDDRTVNALLNGQGAFHVRFPHDGKHVEGDLGNQLLALIYGSKVYRIYPISSGKPSTPTILGHFHVYLRTPGYLPDGMYFSDFFYRGFAIHGYDPAPDYPASHGCMRLPIVDAISVWNWLTYGVVVDTYL